MANQQDEHHVEEKQTHRTQMIGKPFHLNPVAEFMKSMSKAI